MPIGYLVSTTLVALCTLLALAPQRRPAALAALSFRVGIVVNDLPFLTFAWLLASSLLAASEGDLDAAGGRAVLVVAALTTVGLAIIARRQLKAEPVLDRALTDGLGAGWRAGIRPEIASRLRTRLPYRRIFVTPLGFRRHEVERVANIAYGDAGTEHLLDVYRHRARPSTAPMLIHLHGGHFRGGRKSREARPLLTELAARGWVCISANYRLSPAAHFPDHVVDAKRVIAWAREHGPEYGADPATLFVSGSSAGGYLASMAALTANVAEFQPGFEGADTALAGAISFYGYYGTLEESIPRSGPSAWDASAAPPFFVAHGDHDTLVPVTSARRFVEHLRSTSANPVVYAELPWAQHGFDVFHSLRYESVVSAIESFAAWVRSRALS